MRVRARAISLVRALSIRARYPGASIDPATEIAAGCHIVCTDLSRLELRAARIHDACTIWALNGSTLIIDGAEIGRDAVIISAERIEIGAGTRIGERVVIRDQDHVFGGGRKLTETGVASTPVSIGRRVRIGDGSTILRGVRVGDDAQVLPHSVVKRDVPSGAKVGGVPARPVSD